MPPEILHDPNPNLSPSVSVIPNNNNCNNSDEGEGKDDMLPGVFISCHHGHLQMGRMVQGEQDAGKGEEDADMDMPPRILVNDRSSVSKMTTTTTAPATTTTATPTVSLIVPHISPGALSYTFLSNMSLATATTTSLTTSVGIRIVANSGYSGTEFGSGSAYIFFVSPSAFVSSSAFVFGFIGRNGGTIMSVAYPSQLPPCSLYRDMSNWNGIGNGDIELFTVRACSCSSSEAETST
ncbi:hypothetical protein GYMLUDRAFT_252581 [Collybiopsis luxurians FD-317 M1]|uniref:Unplaced genomic scaffold GYMLUscaffold_133, whole genome shotgun sequence n=1 Tax=Collybiopsis luxurians FD-317 M1 TaxID=944289 RepID=A0A0D0AKW0_9AGAR|nr:hypothetical protein GYMLUDRAFT_252581 [Collybiopsis luxurians FD-317 M1]